MCGKPFLHNFWIHALQATQPAHSPKPAPSPHLSRNSIAVRKAARYTEAQQKQLWQQPAEAAVSVIIVCCKIVARPTGPVWRTWYQYMIAYIMSACTVWLADAGTECRRAILFHTIIYHIMPTHAHRTLRNTDHMIGFDEKPTEKPTEKSSVLVSVLFGSNRPKPIDVLGKNRKTDRATFHFRFTTLLMTHTYIGRGFVFSLVLFVCMVFLFIQ